VVYFGVTENGAVLDISAATSLELLFQPPPKSGLPLLTKTATFRTNGTDGFLQYVIQADDIPLATAEVGQWRVAASFTLGSWSGRTSFDTFQCGWPLI